MTNYPGDNDPYGGYGPDNSNNPQGGYGYEPPSFSQNPGGNNPYDPYGGAYGAQPNSPHGFGQPGYGQQPFGGPGYGQPQFGQQYAYNSQGFGAMQPHPAPGEAMPIPGLDVGRVISDSWDGFTQNIGGWIVWCLAYIVGLIATMIALIAGSVAIIAPMVDDPNYTSGSSTYDTEFDPFNGLAWGAIGWIGLLYLILIVFTIVMMNTIYGASLRIVAGERLTVADFFKLRNFGTYILTMILIGVAYGLIFAIPFVGIILIFPLMFLYFLPYAAVDGQPIGKCFSIAWGVLFKNFGLCALCAIIFAAFNFIGGLVIVGYFITLPMMMVASAVVYRASTRGYQPIPKPMPYVPGY